MKKGIETLFNLKEIWIFKVQLYLLLGFDFCVFFENLNFYICLHDWPLGANIKKLQCRAESPCYNFFSYFGIFL